MEQPCQQRRDDQAGQIICQLNLADFKDNKGHGARDKSSGDVDNTGQAVRLEERLGAKLADLGERAENGIYRKGRERGRPAKKFLMKPVIASASMTAFTTSR